MRWAAPGRRLVLGPTKPPQSIRPDDWGDVVSAEVRAVLLVSAVHARVECIGRWPMSHVLFTRRPIVARVSVGGRITVTSAEGRTGELFAFPLAYLDDPTTASNQQRPNQP
jgi:hypothetical protein